MERIEIVYNNYTTIYNNYYHTELAISSVLLYCSILHYVLCGVNSANHNYMYVYCPVHSTL